MNLRSKTSKSYSLNRPKARSNYTVYIMPLETKEDGGKKRLKYLTCKKLNVL